MARLLHKPRGLPENFREPLSGPRTIGAASTQTIGGFSQTVANPFGLWRWRFGFASNMRGQIARRFRGWIMGFHGGANASRVTMCDWDGLSREQMGVQSSRAVWKAGQNWSNGKPWSNGQRNQSSPPMVSVAATSEERATSISLANEHWGRALGIGDMVGFMPFHFGGYMVTQVLGDGVYRIWPPLRKRITTSTYANLRPVLAMRMEGEEAASFSRDASFLQNPTIILVEVLDSDVRDYFADVI